MCNIQQNSDSLHVHLVIIINPRHACVARVIVARFVCVCVSVSFESHLTSEASVRPENTVTYSAGNKDQNICRVFSETAPLQRSSTLCIVRLLYGLHFHSTENAHAHYSTTYHFARISCCLYSYIYILTTVACCSASGSSKDRLDTPPAKEQSRCQSVCSLISSMFLWRGFFT